MLKCINDKTKSYTGKEPSPKGLGICASGEEVGKVMVGKDGSNWIVVQTKRCKKWAKSDSIPKLNSESTPLFKKEFHEEKYKNEIIDFDNLEEDCYTYSYIPEFSKTKIIDETGLEQKFGGKKPFFTKDEEWPLHNGIGMEFLCQFIDPRKEDNTLIRIFNNFYEDDIYDERNPVIKILPIELSDENLKKQVILLNPYEDGCKYPSFEIKSWKPCKELKQLSYILEKYQIRFMFPKYFSMYNSSKYVPYSEIKIGGTPVYYKNVQNERRYLENFLQLTTCDYSPFSWNNYAIMHLNINGRFDYDLWTPFFYTVEEFNPHSG